MGLEAADAPAQAAGHDLDLVADAERSIDERTGDDRPEARHRERAVDRQARPRKIAPGWCRAKDTLERREQVVESVAGRRGDLDDGCVRERRSAERPAHLVARQGGPLVVDEVALGEHDDAAADAEELEDREVLAGLRHDALIGGDHK